MSNKKLYIFARCSILVVATSVLFLCVLLPVFFIGISEPLMNDTSINMAYILTNSLIVLYWTVTAICLIVLGVIWRITRSIKTGTLFTSKIVKQVKLCTILLLSDLGIFFIGNAVVAILGATFSALNYQALVVVMSIVIIPGLVVSVFMAIIAFYLGKAAVLKEEIEATI